MSNLDLLEENEVSLSIAETLFNDLVDGILLERDIDVLKEFSIKFDDYSLTISDLSKLLATLNLNARIVIT